MSQFVLEQVTEPLIDPDAAATVQKCVGESHIHSRKAKYKCLPFTNPFYNWHALDLLRGGRGPWCHGGGHPSSITLHYIIFHLADSFIQSNLQYVHSTMRVQTQNNKNQASIIFFKKAKLQSAISKCHKSAIVLSIIPYHQISMTTSWLLQPKPVSPLCYLQQ